MPISELERITTLFFARPLRIKELSPLFAYLDQETGIRLKGSTTKTWETDSIASRRPQIITTEIDVIGTARHGSYELRFACGRFPESVADMTFDYMEFSNHHPWQNLEQIPPDARRMLDSLHVAGDKYFATLKQRDTTRAVPAVS